MPKLKTEVIQSEIGRKSFGKDCNLRGLVITRNGLFICFCETGFSRVAQSGLELLILLRFSLAISKG